MESSQQKIKRSKGLSPFAFSKVTGIAFIATAVLITLFIRCPGKAHFFIIYALIGVGIALLLTKSAEKTTASVKAWNISVALAGGVALPFILFFTNPVGAFKFDNCSSLVGVTVFVHGKNGRQDMVLRQQGYVLMDVNGERKREDISEKGTAHFQNLLAGDQVKLEIDFSEPYRSIYPDSIYTIPEDGRIYLPVNLQGIGKVEGMVLYADQPLKGVLVKIGTLADSTDNTGDFSITVPEANQSREYKVWFIKEGFKTKSAPAFPQTGRPLEIVMEKLPKYSLP